MICQTIDIVDGNFCGYPVHFQAVCILDKEPADCKLLLETVK